MTPPGQDPVLSSPLIHRLPFMLLVVVILTIGLWAGLDSLGWQFASSNDPTTAQHGPLMISGFVGSVIALERAIALVIFDHKRHGIFQRVLSWLVPLANIAGSLLLLSPSSNLTGHWIITAASIGLLVIELRILDLTPGLHTLLKAVGAGGWAFGNLLWLSEIQFSALLPAWAMFVILTFIGERFELDRIPSVRPWVLAVFYAGTGLVIAGALLSPLNTDWAIRSSGLGALILALWLVKFDIARNSIQMTGLSRFSALAVIASFGWLGLYGLLALRFGFTAQGGIYAAEIHSLFIGFAGGMILGQTPVILPAFLGFRAIYHDGLMPMAIGLQLALAVRIFGEIVNWPAGRQWGGLLNAAIGLIYIIQLLALLWMNRRTA